MKHSVLYCFISAVLLCLLAGGCNNDEGDSGYFILSIIEKGDPGNGTHPNDVEVLVAFADSKDLFFDTIDTADVRVNGTQALLLLFYFVLTGNPAISNVGDDVILTCTDGAKVITATEQLPEAPVITDPAPGSNHNADSAITVTWNVLSTLPDRIVVSIEDSTHTVGDEGWESVPLSPLATTIDIPANVLKTGQTNVKIKVAGANFTKEFTGGKVRNSSYHEVRHTDTVEINTN